MGLDYFSRTTGWNVSFLVKILVMHVFIVRVVANGGVGIQRDIKHAR